jgi:hypothetical protein
MPLPSSGPLSLNDIQGEFGGTNPIGMNEYYAGGGLVPAGTTGTFGAVPSSGALSVQNFYGTSQFVPIYIEDVFSTWIYTGTGATQTITNGINLSGNGGMVWTKVRSTTDKHVLEDTVRGVGKSLSSNNEGGQANNSFTLQSFLSNGYTVAQDSATGASSQTYVSWTFREQPKFFDIVTYTGNGVNGRQISHNLGSTPGCVIVKRLSYSPAGNWIVCHRGANFNMWLNSTNGEGAGEAQLDGFIQKSSLSSTTFTLFGGGNGISAVNESGVTYVAYLFAHDAGGFGLTGTDNVITCGSMTNGTEVNLGYEPQWILFKQSDGVSSWFITDVMRGMTSPLYISDAGGFQYLNPNSSGAEFGGSQFRLTSTGFYYGGLGGSIIYVAIRRGPMKVPTTGTSVFSPVLANDPQGTAKTTGFPVDLQMIRFRSFNSGTNSSFVDRLRGVSTNSSSSNSPYLVSSSTNAESTALANTQYFNNTGYQVSSYYANLSEVMHNFQRAPGFFDEVCYTGTSTARTIRHNLGVAPELIILKNRLTSGYVWVFGSSYLNGGSLPWRYFLYVNTTDSLLGPNQVIWNNTAPTSSVFSVGTSGNVNATDDSYVAYLFATCPGVSKVGSFTGTGATQVINCGFTGGARFVLIKATSTTGDWYVWDSARGIVAGNDPYLTLNTTGPEVTGTDWVDTAASGFELSNSGGNLANSNGVSYIFLAIA